MSTIDLEIPSGRFAAGVISPGVKVRYLTPAMRKRWDSFVMSCPAATFFHLAGWRDVIYQAFNHDTYYLYAEFDGDIQGILPLVHINSWMFGNALISMPFCVHGGAAAITEEARQALVNAACSLANKLNVDYLEMRHRERQYPRWPVKDELYVEFRKTLASDPEQNLHAIPRKQRAMVRKGIQAGLISELDSDVERFYLAYSQSVRNLGTPVFSKRYFKLLKYIFNNDCRILTITHQGKIVSSVMSFYFRDQVMPYYGGGTALARTMKGNDFMYWELMRRSCEEGILVFDYGRSKVGTGSYDFKRNWGFQPEPLYYEYFLVKGSKVPDINPLNPKYRVFINLWKRLPLSISTSLGPLISRNLG